MIFKFTIFDKETAYEVKKLLKDKKKYLYDFYNEKDEMHSDLNNNVEKKKRGRKKLTKEEKELRKKKRTPEEQLKINERMKKLREIRLAKKKK